MELGRTIIVTEVNLGTTVYGCYVETISGITYSYFRNRYMENRTAVNLYTSPSVQGGEQFGSNLGDSSLYYAYIPYYGISGKAVNGVCLKNKGIDPAINQGFNGRAASPVEGKVSYNNARAFNFQRAPTAVYRPFNIEGRDDEETTDTYRQHNLRVTNNRLIGDDRVHEFQQCEPCVVCYVINAVDATVNNTQGTKIPFRQKNTANAHPPSDGISWFGGGESDGGCGEGLSGNAVGHTSYRNTTVHMYIIKSGANISYDMFSDGNYIAAHDEHVEKITEDNVLYDLYYDIVNPTGFHYTMVFNGDGINPDADPPSPRCQGPNAHQGQKWNTGVNNRAAGICNDYSSVMPYDDDQSHGDNGTGRFSLQIDMTLPTVGIGSLPQGSSTEWLVESSIFAREPGTLISLFGDITVGYPGMGDPATMFFNFLDTSSRPKTLTYEGNTYTYTSASSEGCAFGGVFLRPSANLRSSSYVFIVPGDCALQPQE